MPDDIDNLLDNAIVAHEAKDFASAAINYTEILARDAHHADANHNFGILNIQLGFKDKSIEFLHKAVKKNPQFSQYWITFINTLTDLEMFSDARSFLNHAVSSGFKDEAFDQLRHNLDLKEQLNKASYTDIESKGQNPPKSEMQRITSLLSKGQNDRVLAEVSKLLLEFPRSFKLYNIVGTATQKLGNLDGSIAAYNKAILMKPDCEEAFYKMAHALREKGKLDCALKAFNKVISINSKNPSAHFNVGNILDDQGKLDEAISAYKNAISLNPNFSEAYNNMGNSLKMLGSLDEALGAYSKAININPAYAQAAYNMGVVHEDKGNFKAAIGCYDKALENDPNFETAAWDNALCCLRSGEYRKGWKLWRRRFRYDGLKDKNREFRTAKLWNGEDKINSILLWREQGLGDELMFANYFHLIKAQNRFFEVSPRLESIFKRSFPNDTVYAKKEKPNTLANLEEDYEYHMPFGDVGPLFNIGKTVNPSAYLVADPKLISDWSKIRENKKLTIGLSWRSGDMSKERQKHYSSLAQWTRLLNLETVQVISTQYSDIDDDLNSITSDVRKRLYIPDVDMKNDLEALAAILVNCDLVIGPATATTMLAGSMGKRTICLMLKDCHFVHRVNSGEKGRHAWLENGQVYVFDKNNQDVVINNLIDEIVLGENW